MSTPVIHQNPQVGQGPEAVILPTLFGVGYHNYDARPNNFIFSMLAHVLAALLLVFGGQFIWQNRVQLRQAVDLSQVGSIILPSSSTAAGGGGGGGDMSKIAANKGTAPKLDLDRVTPPAAVIRNDNPKLVVEQSVAVLPNIKLPKSNQIGDPLSAALVLSNGAGVSSGVGSGAGGGLGSGSGAGLGPGSGGNTGGGVFRVGGGVSAPIAIYSPEPEFSEEARKAKYQGTVLVQIVVGSDGRPRDMKIVRPLGMGLDEKALEAVKEWRFKPAQKDGHAVNALAVIEVNFNMY